MHTSYGWRLRLSHAADWGPHPVSGICWVRARAVRVTDFLSLKRGPHVTLLNAFMQNPSGETTSVKPHGPLSSWLWNF